MATLVLALPDRDFEPAEAAVPWRALRAAGHAVVFATPDARPATCDPVLLDGALLGWHWWGRFGAPPEARALYAEMTRDPAFRAPIRYEHIDPANHAGLVLPGGHAPGMKTYLESAVLQEKAARYLLSGRPVAAVCHGPIVLARAKDPATGRPALAGRTVAALPRRLEYAAWLATFWFRGRYYRTYPQSVQAEVTAALGPAGRFDGGPLDASYANPWAVRDRNLVTARWPGDLERWASLFVDVVRELA